MERDSGLTSVGLSRQYAECASAFLPPLNESTLRSILFNIKRSKSPGFDGIRVGDLCRNFDTIKVVLLSMLNGFFYPRLDPEWSEDSNSKTTVQGRCTY